MTAQLAMAPVALWALAQPAAAISHDSLLSLFALLQLLGSLGFAWLGVHADKDFFLLLGNVVCAFGAGVWVAMLLDEGGNTTWIAVFAVLGVLSVYAIVVMFRKYRDEGIDDTDSDSDGGDGGGGGGGDRGKARHTDASAAPAPAQAAGVRRRRK